MSGRLLLLGTPGLEVAGGRVDLFADRPTSLLLYLAARGGWVGRGEIALLYHPDSAEAAARSNVRKLLHRLRHLEHLPDGAVTVEGDRVRVDLASDRAAFLDATARADWGAALALWRGPFLDGFALKNAPGFSAWLDLERADLARRWQQSTTRSAEAREADGDLEGALALFGRLREADPLDEEALQGAMRLLDALGRRRPALEAFEAFATRLHEALEVAPLDTTTALADAIRRKRGRPAAPATERPPPLPAPTTPFVGRSEELTALEGELARPEVRLLTLCGLGGIGKTRLALALAERVRDRYPDGVWPVALAGTDDPERLLTAIAAAMGLTLTGGTTAAEQLRDQLRHRRALLLLDNLEQLVDAAPTLCALLAGAPDLTIVATSRVPLELSCETVVPLRGLPYPDAESAADPTRFDGVALFLERARRADAGFYPDADDLRHIAAIVAGVEGMPLAIELAAGWMRSLDPGRLRRDLERGPELLHTRLRDLPERQRSVVAVLEYTLERLPMSERDALARLAVFAGAFTLEAAEAVAEIRLGQLFTLMNRALLRRTPDGRYQLHALVRQIARRDSGGDALAQRHAGHFVAVAERTAEPLHGRGQLEALAALFEVWDDLLQAWGWAADRGDAALLERSYDALLYACYLRSLFALERALVARALAGPLDGGAPLRTALLGRRADALRRLGDLAGAARDLDDAERRLDGEDAPTLRALVRMQRGRLSEAQADYSAARRAFHDLDPRALPPGERIEREQSLGNLAYYADGDLAACEAHYRTALAMAEALGDGSLLGAALINLGGAALDRGDHAAAEQYWRRAEGIVGRLGQRQRLAVILNNLGHLASVRGDPETATERYRRSLTLRREIGDERGGAHTLNNLARLDHALGEHAAAAERFEEALARYRDLGDDSGVAYTLSGYARTLLALDAPARAEACALEALTLAADTGDRTDTLSSLTTLAMVRLDQGGADAAFRLAALVVREAAGSHEGVRSYAERVVDACRDDLGDERLAALEGEVARLDLATVTAELLA